MAANDYIPKDDFSFRSWAESLCACIAGEPEKYRFSAEDAAELAAAVRNFTTAMHAGSNPFTRTPIMVRDKRDERKRCESMCRRFAMAIKSHPSISDEDKIRAGVPLPSARESRRVERPQTRPLLYTPGATPHALLIRYADSQTPHSRAKPHGVSRLDLYMGAGHGLAPDACRFIGSFTRDPIEVEYPGEDDYQHVTIYGRWTTTRGESGPWSEPLHTWIVV